MTITLVTWALALAAVAHSAQGFAVGTSARHDLTAYAIANCLRQQPDAKMKLDGENWASIIVERGKVDIDALAMIARGVKRDVGRGKAD